MNETDDSGAHLGMDKSVRASGADAGDVRVVIDSAEPDRCQQTPLDQDPKP